MEFSSSLPFSLITQLERQFAFDRSQKFDSNRAREFETSGEGREGCLSLLPRGGTMGLVVSTRQTLRLSKRRLSRRLARKLTREPVVSRYYAGNSYDWMATLGEVKGWTERRVSVIYGARPEPCGPAILPRSRVKFFNSSSVNWKLCEINLSRSNVNTVFRRHSR